MRSVFIAVLIGLQTLCFGQIDLYLSNYNISEEKNSILVTWTTSAGFTCADIQIKFGTDSNMMESVYTYPGICGSEQKEEQYTYLFRTAVYNQPNYIQIDLGTYGLSSILALTIVGTDGLNPKVYPNPATNLSTLIFQNPNLEVATISVFDGHGQSIIDPMVTNNNSFKISELNIKNPGIYFYIVEIKGIQLRGKFLFL